MQANTISCQEKPYTILITGATGFIGSRLVDSFTNKGHSVKALSRKDMADRQNVRFVKADMFNIEQLEAALNEVDVAYYLVHSMEGDKKRWKEFASRERIQAQNFLKAATKARVKRIIYLGGLADEDL
jgi:nucleoside-diphosphate-sugar epimerase